MPRSTSMRGKTGQTMVETSIVTVVLCLVFFLLFDYARLVNCRTVLDYAASRCARARAVGFNDFMILKTARLGTMSVSGKSLLTMDDSDRPPSTSMLLNRMGSYLQTDSPAETHGILDFELWQPGNLGWSCAETRGDSGEITMHVWQKQPVFNAFNPPGSAERPSAAAITLHGNAKIESHYPFYLK